MIYLILQILIVFASIGVAVYYSARARYWRFAAAFHKRRAEIFYRQFVDLVKTLDNEWSENE